MPKFRKKPVEIDAFQNNDPFEVVNWASQFNDEIRWKVLGGKENLAIIIPTLEGEMRADRGDWIIRGVNGEFYPCKPDIFEKTYEPVEA